MCDRYNNCVNNVPNVFNVNTCSYVQYIVYCHSDVCFRHVERQYINWWCKRVQAFNSYFSKGTVSGQLIYFQGDDMFSQGFFLVMCKYNRGHIPKGMCASTSVILAGGQ